MKCLLPLLSLLISALVPLSASAKEKKPYVVYAEFVENTPVELSDGAHWMMDKGDCFPIYMFKERQTKVVLQLGKATFWTDAARIRVVKDGEENKAMLSYQKMLDSYLKSRAAKQQ